MIRACDDEKKGSTLRNTTYAAKDKVPAGANNFCNAT